MVSQFSDPSDQRIAHYRRQQIDKDKSDRQPFFGEMAEWLIALALKTGML